MSTQEVCICGYCNKIIKFDKNDDKQNSQSGIKTNRNNSKKSSIPEEKFIKKCSCCGKDSQLHMKCAIYVMNQNIQSQHHKLTSITADEFNKTNIQTYYCEFCRQTECFHCQRSHQFSEYYPFLIYVFVILAYSNISFIFIYMYL